MRDDIGTVGSHSVRMHVRGYYCETYESFLKCMELYVDEEVLRVLLGETTVRTSLQQTDERWWVHGMGSAVEWSTT